MKNDFPQNPTNEQGVRAEFATPRRLLPQSWLNVNGIQVICSKQISNSIAYA